MVTKFPESVEGNTQSLSLSLALSLSVCLCVFGNRTHKERIRGEERRVKPLDGVNNKSPGEKNRWTFREREREKKEREGCDCQT